MSDTSIIVKIAAYIAAWTFNKGCFALLTLMQDIKIGTGPSAHEWARPEDSNRISRAEQQAAHESKEDRTLRREEHKDALDMGDDIAALHESGIDDSV